MGNLKDAVVVERVLQGDKDAYAGLVIKYQRQIYNLMLRATSSPEEAADLTQETFIKAYEKLESYHTNRKFFTWLYTLGLNHLRDYCRRKRPEPMDNADLEKLMNRGEHAEDHNRPWEAEVNSRELARAVKQLPLDYREALMLRYHEQMELSEVAEVLGIGLSAAKMRIHRGLAKLRFLMTGERHD